MLANSIKQLGKASLRLPTFLAAGISLSLLACYAAPTPAATETPKSADAFVDSVGINTRLSYTDWPTASNWDNPDPAQNIRQLLVNTGIRHVRDRIPNPSLEPNITYVNPRLAQLYRDNGIRFLTGIDTRNNNVLDTSKIQSYVDWFAKGTISLDGQAIPVRSLLEATEGPNEYDMHHHQSSRDPNWSTNLRAYQAAIHQKVRASSVLASLPILMPSLVHTPYCGSPLGSLSNVSTYGNLHSYPNYPYMKPPSSNLGWHLDNVSDCVGTKKSWVTETGYFTRTGNNKELSEATAAKYTSRLIAEYFRSGKISRTYLYNLVTGGVDGWGLIAAQKTSTTVNGWQQYSLRPKPSYHAVKSLNKLLGEATWSKTEKRWNAPAVNLRAINLSFEGKDANTRHLLLQKSNNRYYLLLWQEVESFNPTQGNFTPSPDKVTVVLPAGSRPQALHKYNSQFTFGRHSLEGSSSRLSIDVPDSVTVLEFIPPAQ
ncbi:hypothetical protein [Pseudanabaena sp. FACHB-2040]|uniref:hypothetical protein n=1 Tax=Pseudanabaena sp. FACHB-2040 TaxID=2692859 RepID=UPI00168909C0|nr:hypothetical protein [Pseudanabaena sp. FACHB-2040]MBD2260562.1 hypothetical protein [Pseudanabaena sp. FACHB-2040]